MSAAPVRVVFFDVGGTLIEPWPSVGAVYAAVGARHGLAVGGPAMDRAFRAAWRTLNRERLPLTTSSKDWWRRLVTATLHELGLADNPAYFEELYEAFARAAAWRVFPDVAETLRRARLAGLHVGVISNWDDRLRPLLTELGLTGFDSVTISCEVGVEKPDPRIFQAALAAAGVEPGAALHLGDSPTEDVAGAAAVGMRAGLVERPANDLRGALRATLPVCG